MVAMTMIDVDITKFLRQIKRQNFSFTFAFVYAVCKCANEVEAFRYCLLDDNIILFDKIDTAFTYLNKDTELFKVVNVPMQDTVKEYVELAVQTTEEQKGWAGCYASDGSGTSFFCGWNTYREIC